MAAIITFLLTGAIVVIAGSLLARWADTIGEHTGLGRLWIGSILLAGATSLPELTTDVYAVQIGEVDLAVGDLLGSGMANMLILAIIDLVPPRQEVLRHAAFDHALSACLGITLTALVAIFIFAPLGVDLFGVGLEPLILGGIYAFGARAVYLNTMRPRESERREVARENLEAAAEATTPERPGARGDKRALVRALLGFMAAATVILVTAPQFALAAKQLAEMSGLGTTFVGTWLVGFATSLPELVSSLTAVRMGAFDLAVGNLLGSNAMNMLIFIPLDLAYQDGPIFSALSPAHAITAMFVILLMGLGLAAIMYRAQRRFHLLEPDSFLILTVYVLGLVLLYHHTVTP